MSTEKGVQAASELDRRSKCERTPKPTIKTAKRGKVMRYQIFLAALALWILTGVTALANPALMQKSKPGYPYPGTTQITIFGEEAIEKSILNENLQAGEVPDQASRGSEARGKLLPTYDSQLSPHPELDTMPSEKSKTRVN
jgi:hypothetical protein